MPRRPEPARLSAVDMLSRAAHAIGTLLFAAFFLVFIVQVSARFLLKTPLPWTDELAVVLYLWAIFWAAGFMAKPSEHVAFDFLVTACRPQHQILLTRVGLALAAVLALWAIPGSFDYIRFMFREKTPVLDIPMAWVFLPFLLLIASIAVRNLWVLGAAFLHKR